MDALLTEIRAARKSIDVEQQGLRDSVDRVLADVWNVGNRAPEELPDLELFEQRLQTLALEVQAAFSEADRTMMNDESVLRDLYLTLRSRLERGRREAALGPKDQQWLDEEIRTADDNRSTMMRVLELHHRWQYAHDGLEGLDAFRELPPLFKSRLQWFKDAPAQSLLRLVDEELIAVRATTPNSAFQDTKAVASPAPQQLLTDAAQLELDLHALRSSLEALRAGPTIERVDDMRKRFDDTFYVIDKRTLNEVERARERAVRLETWLDTVTAGLDRLDGGTEDGADHGTDPQEP
jgi:hypothetical protein